MSGDVVPGANVEPLRLRVNLPPQDLRNRANKEPLPVELWDDIKPVRGKPWLVRGLLGTGSLIVLFGAPGSGKTFLSLDIAASIAAGRDWFGHGVTAGPAVYVAAEGQTGVRARITAWKQEHGDTDRQIPFALVPSAVSLLDPLADLQRLAIVLEQLHARWGSIALLVIDTLSASFGGGDENGPDMANFVANVNRLRAPYQAAALIVHHQPVAADNHKRPRGHGSLLGAVDTALHVTGDSNASARRLHCVKQKDDAPGPDILFKLMSVEIGRDDDGEPVRSCVIEPLGHDALASASGKSRRKLTANHTIVLRALEAALIAEGVAPPPKIPDDVLSRLKGGKVVSLDMWRKRALSGLGQFENTKADSLRTAFNRARESLQSKEYVGIWEDWAWLL